MLCPVAAMAAVDFHPYAGTQYEYDSNVFSFSNRQDVIAATGGTQKDDTLLRYFGGIDVSLTPGQQRFYASAEARRVQFERFDELDHNEHLLLGGLDWKLGSRLDGKLEYRRERSMASFADIETTQLTVQTEETGNAALNLLLTPRWRIETGAKTRKVELPLPEFPDFALKENTGSAEIKYLGFSKLSAGILGQYTDGEYEGSPDANQFEQGSLQLTADYVVSGLSAFNAELGAIRRKNKNGDGDDTSGFTGALGYKRELSGKTSVSAQLFRRINSYVAGANALVDTGASLGALWQATPKIVVSTQYQWTHSDFKTGDSVASINDNRTDKFGTAAIDLRYQALDWLLLRPYGEYHNRSSSTENQGYDGAVLGLELRLRF